MDDGACGTIGEGRMKAGSYFNIDNFIITKSYKNRNPIFRWESLWDGSGITNYSYVLDQNKYTIPDTIGEGLTNSIKYSNLSDGEWYFHIRAKDGAGNWGDVNSYFIKIIRMRFYSKVINAQIC